MTHEQLVDAVFEKQISSVDCMKQRCKGEDCEECSENLVREYENKIRADMIVRIKKSVKNVLNSYNPSYTDIYNVISELSDIVVERIEIFEEQLKEVEK